MEVAALLAMLAGSLLAVVLGLEIRFVGVLAACLAPAGAAFVVARYYTYDSYYGPEARRISDVAFVPPEWMVALAVAALVAGLATKLRPAIGSALTAVVLFLCAFTFFWQMAGH